MQLMPSTASVLGVRNSFDPRENIEGGVRHLRGLLDRFPGNLSFAIAAYNAGEKAVTAYGGSRRIRDAGLRGEVLRFYGLEASTRRRRGSIRRSRATAPSPTRTSRRAATIMMGAPKWPPTPQRSSRPGGAVARLDHRRR